jgi:hypothetical protein
MSSKTVTVFVLGMLAGCGSSGASDPAATKDAAAQSPPAESARPVNASPPSAATSDAPASPPATAASTSPGPASSPLGLSSAPIAPAPAKALPSVAGPATSKAAPEAQRGPVAGKPWQLVATAEADAGYKCNAEYPNKFTTTGGTNVTYPDPKPRGGCAGKGVAVTIPIVPTAAGPGTVVGTLSYGICDEAKTSCLIRKKNVTLAFNAAP